MQVLPYSGGGLPMSIGSTFKNQNEKVELNSSPGLDAQQVYKETKEIAAKKSQEINYLGYNTSGGMQSVKSAVGSIINTQA